MSCVQTRLTRTHISEPPETDADPKLEPQANQKFHSLTFVPLYFSLPILCDTQMLSYDATFELGFVGGLKMTKKFVHNNTVRRLTPSNQETLASNQGKKTLPCFERPLFHHTILVHDGPSNHCTSERYLGLCFPLSVRRDADGRDFTGEIDPMAFEKRWSSQRRIVVISRMPCTHTLGVQGLGRALRQGSRREMPGEALGAAPPATGGSRKT